MPGILILFAILLCAVVPATATAQVSIGIGLPNLQIGINLPLYPRLVRVPGYPVYYSPDMDFNYFFYDGLYWVYQDDYWYASSWYNGPWDRYEPEYVPLFVLRVPVRYYRHPPVYFSGWQRDAPPRWGEHWGNQWEQRHNGWDKWDRKSIPAPAPLPTYQRQYTGDRYPKAEQQKVLQSKHYNYSPRDSVQRQSNQGQRAAVPAAVQRPVTRSSQPVAQTPEVKNSNDSKAVKPDTQRASSPVQQSKPVTNSEQRPAPGRDASGASAQQQNRQPVSGSATRTQSAGQPQAASPKNQPEQARQNPGQAQKQNPGQAQKQNPEQSQPQKQNRNKKEESDNQDQGKTSDRR